MLFASRHPRPETHSLHFFHIWWILIRYRSIILGAPPPQPSRSVCFHCTALSQCISSDVIMINVNHAGFTVCLFYSAVGRVRPGPIYENSRWQPWRRWNWGGDLDDVLLGCNVGLSHIPEQRLCLSVMSDCETFPALLTNSLISPPWLSLLIRRHD